MNTTLEEMVIAVNVSAEGAQEGLDALEDAFARLQALGGASLEALGKKMSSVVQAVEHLRHVGEINAQEEIAMLQAVKSRFAKTAEEIMAIDRKLHDARQALRKAEEGKITSLYTAVTGALTARYEEQRQQALAELEGK